MSDPTIDDQIRLTGGQDFWHTPAVEAAGLPSVTLTDGPHGVRLQAGAGDHLGLNDAIPATCFPPAVSLASTWSPRLAYDMGVALGEECQALGVGILLGPGMNIKRSPLCGRNFEYLSEDPILSGELAIGLVNGVQSQGIGTSVKHFAANNQETDRQRRDSQVDERTLREIYLRGFGKVVRAAQPWTVMCSYNRLNGVYASENHWLLTTVLRDEWGFEGFVVSDWGAVHDRVASLIAGLDLEMPVNHDHEMGVRQALADGLINRAVIEQAYDRVARVLRRAIPTPAAVADPTMSGLSAAIPTVSSDQPVPADSAATIISTSTATTAPAAGFDVEAHHQLARRVAEQSVVLLSNDGILPLAPTAKVAVVGEFARTPRYQGAGSSRVNPTRLDNALDAITALVGHEVPFAPGFTTAPGQMLAPDARDQAVTVAAGADLVLAFLGLGEDHESEGFDRTTMDLPSEQLSLLDDILAVNSNVVVVLSNGSSVLLPFADRVRAIIEAWLPGQAGGPALADIIYGVVNPSGKLTETIPQRLADVPSYPYFPGDTTGVRYGEGLFVGYRGYDQMERAVAFPFGHGLSYTSFAYTDLVATAHGDGLLLTATVTNTGSRAGREIVQAYVGLPGSRVVRPIRELKGFATVELTPGEAAPMRIELSAEDLSYWSVADQAWLVEGGQYEVWLGASSRDLRLSARVDLAGNEPVRRLTMESTLGEALAVPAFAAALTQMASGTFGAASANPELLRMMADSPLSVIAGFLGQGPLLQQLLDAVNAG